MADLLPRPQRVVQEVPKPYILRVTARDQKIEHGEALACRVDRLEHGANHIRRGPLADLLIVDLVACNPLHKCLDEACLGLGQVVEDASVSLRFGVGKVRQPLTVTYPSWRAKDNVEWEQTLRV